MVVGAVRCISRTYMQALLKSPPFLLQLRSLHCHPPRDGACQWQPFTGFLAFRCGVERGVDVGSWLGVVIPRAANGFVRNPDIRVEAGGLLPFGHARQDAAVFKACGRDELHEGREDARAAADDVWRKDVFRDAGTVNHERRRRVRTWSGGCSDSCGRRGRR